MTIITVSKGSDNNGYNKKELLSEVHMSIEICIIRALEKDTVLAARKLINKALKM